MRLLALVLVTAALGCATKEATPLPAPAPAPVAAPPPASRGSVTGRVLETLEVPSFTYLRLGTATGEQWAAVPTTAVTVGSEVTLANQTLMQNFVSKTLGRTFPQILFSSGLERVHPAAARAPPPSGASPEPGFEALSAWADQAAPGTTAPSVTQGGSLARAKPEGKAEVAARVEPVAKAVGAEGRTIAEIYQQQRALIDRPVLLRGKVVKYTAGVLGKNWLHLQDGTGTPAGKDNDIAVTTTDLAALGEIVAVRGPVHLARDFGAGYVFPVMIEDASVVR